MNTVPRTDRTLHQMLSLQTDVLVNRETDGRTDTQIDGQTHKRTYKHRDKQTDMKTDKRIQRSTAWQKNQEKERRKDIIIHRELKTRTDKQTDGWTDG